MSQWFAGRLETWLDLPPARTIRTIHLFGVMAAALLFAAAATFIMSFNAIFVDQALSELAVGAIAPFDVAAPEAASWVSETLTESGRQQAINSVSDVYDLPDADVARQRAQLGRQILDFINDVRRDAYGTREQKVDDLHQINALDLDEAVMLNLLELDDDKWRSVDEQIIDVLERVMQQSIREGDLSNVISRLPNQVSVRFNTQESAIITDIVGDLIRPNTFVNPQETELARQRAAEEFSPVRRTFAAGQRVIANGERVTETDIEALAQLGLLEVSVAERRSAQLRATTQAFIVSVVVMIVIGLFINRFTPAMFDQPRYLLLAAVLFLIFLTGARIIGADGGNIYIYPAAAIALLFVAVFSIEVSLVFSLGLAVMIGFMLQQRLELTTMIAVGGMIGGLTMRRPERINSYFLAGVMIALTNALVITVFNLGGAQNPIAPGQPLTQLLGWGAINGLLSAAAALGLIYLITILFNLPTGLRLVELSQPNQLLLQRLLREAPGTYQHSLQVANLCEQAASAVGANAELVRVAALYHDIGKMLNPHFFVENQADGVNPHDELNDPYRSTDIILSHITEGDKLARQNRLPGRIRDFILEHHGTTRVEYFYRRALAEAAESEEVDPTDFTYPGPIPQSRETAIMMLADSCEGTVRARRPANRQEIQDIVQGIIDTRTRDGQLDESGLTANDLKTVRGVFVDMLQAVFHPRINYPSSMVAPKPKPTPTPESMAETMTMRAVAKPLMPETRKASGEVPSGLGDEDDASPMPEVPSLPRRTGILNATIFPDDDDEKDAP